VQEPWRLLGRPPDATGASGMAEIDDNRLLNLALGLTDDPELREALRTSRELRARFEQVTADLYSLNRELQGSRPAADRRQLDASRWRIMLAFGGSECDQRAAATSASLAAASDGEIVVLHVRVLERPGQGPSIETPTEATQLVSGVVGRLLGEGVKAWGEVYAALRIEIANEIVRAAGDSGADLIVMCSRGRSDVGGLVFGSIVHATLRHAPCPVVVVR
jgi:nucleotide-binding universal stress UspA family protein